MSELEQRVARGIAQAGGFDYERGETAIVMDNYARAALKAHAEWLEEQDWESVARNLWPEYGPLGIKGRADRTREMIAAAQQEDQPNE